MTSFLQCGNDEHMTLYNQTGAPISTECNVICKAGFHHIGSQTATCSSAGEWQANDCEKTFLVLAGGEKAGEVSSNVEVLASSDWYSAHYSTCLPSLPNALQWGSMGFLDDKLIACGDKTCWFLSSKAETWTTLGLPLKR